MEAGPGGDEERGRGGAGSSRPGRRTLLFLLALLPPLLVGGALRLHNLEAQVLGGDELHAVRVAARQSASEILRFRETDHCIPLTLLYHGVLEAGGTLTELRLRVPMLAAGLGLLVLAPLAARGALGPGVAVALAWLLAVSPPLVLYSRIVRPYAPVVLLGWAAVLAFLRWHERGGRGAALLYAGLGAATVYLHLGSAFFVGAPLLWAGALALHRRSPAALRRVAAMGLALGAAVALLLLPAGRSLWALAKAKAGGPLPGAEALARVLALQAGTGSWLVALAFWGLAAAGLALLWRRDRRLALLLAALAGAQALGLALLRPVHVDAPLVLSRYLLVALPAALVAVALALARVAGGRGLRRATGGLAAAAFVALLLATGPFARPGFARGSFTHHNAFLGYDPGAEPLRTPSVPDFYRRLADESGRGAVVEAPWPPLWELSRSLLVYQRLHGREVLVLPYPGTAEDGRVRLRNFVDREPAAILRSRARYLVLHRDPMAEEARLRGGTLFDPRGVRASARELIVPLRAVGGELASELRAAWGPPGYVDEAVRVWDLAAIRGGREAPAAAGRERARRPTERRASVGRPPLRRER